MSAEPPEDPSAHRQADGTADVAALREQITRLSRALEFKRTESESLQRAGSVAEVVAHDINNLLSAVMGHADLALTSKALDREAAAHLNEILGAAKRAAELTGALLRATGGGGRAVRKVPSRASD